MKTESSLRRVRRAANVTQVELAARLGISQASVSAMEQGDAARHPVARLQAIGEALGVPWGDLLPAPAAACRAKSRRR